MTADSLVDELFSDRGLPATRRRIRRRPSGTVTLSVIDRGPGIAPQDQALLFEPFFRATSVRTSGTRVSGLGLPIMTAIIEAQRGANSTSPARWAEGRP